MQVVRSVEDRFLSTVWFSVKLFVQFDLGFSFPHFHSVRELPPVKMSKICFSVGIFHSEAEISTEIFTGVVDRIIFSLNHKGGFSTFPQALLLLL